MLNFSYPIFPKHSKSQNLLFVAWPLSQGRSECPICSFPAGLAMTSLMVPRFRSCKYANAFWFRASGNTPWFGLWISRKCAHPRKCDGDRPAPDPGSFGTKIAQRKALHLEPHDELSLPDPLALLKKKYPFGNPWNHLKKITRNMPSKIRRTIKKKSRLPIVTKSLRFLVGWGRIRAFPLLMKNFPSPLDFLCNGHAPSICYGMFYKKHKTMAKFNVQYSTIETVFFIWLDRRARSLFFQSSISSSSVLADSSPSSWTCSWSALPWAPPNLLHGNGTSTKGGGPNTMHGDIASAPRPFIELSIPSTWRCVSKVQMPLIPLPALLPASFNLCIFVSWDAQRFVYCTAIYGAMNV